MNDGTIAQYVEDSRVLRELAREVYKRIEEARAALYWYAVKVEEIETKPRYDRKTLMNVQRELLRRNEHPDEIERMLDHERRVVRMIEVLNRCEKYGEGCPFRAVRPAKSADGEYISGKSLDEYLAKHRELDRTRTFDPDFPAPKIGGHDDSDAQNEGGR